MKKEVERFREKVVEVRHRQRRDNTYIIGGHEEGEQNNGTEPIHKTII